jgi:hypothetical protein
MVASLSASAQTSGASTAAAANLTFTNSAGKSYTVDNLATQLQRLQQAVDETLPVLTAFNETFGATNTTTVTGSRTLVGSLSNAVAGVWQRRSNRDTNTLAATPTDSSTKGKTYVTNAVAVLRDLLAPSGGTASATAATSSLDNNTVQELVTLQTNLQPTASILKDLHLGTTNTLTPTGR